MRLSEAIMLGHSEIRPTNWLWLEGYDDGSCAGCAAGAALWAMGHREFPREAWTIEEALGKHWPWVRKWSDSESVSFGYAITRYFSRVADWVRSIEPQEDSPATIDAGNGSKSQLVEREEVHVR
jgi:hypothetical protein